MIMDYFVKNQKHKKNIEIIIYRNYIDETGTYVTKFLKPGITDNKIAFELQLEVSNCISNYLELINNLEFSIDLVIISKIVNDEDICKYKELIKDISIKNDNAKAMEQYKATLFENLDNMDGVVVQEHFILVDKKYEDRATPFFNKFGFTIKYSGEAERILDKYTLSEEEYCEYIERMQLVNDFEEDIELED